MILKSLYLKNYRTYQGPEKIEFATGSNNITIIKGNNEVGKTTIMNAVTWCLYGEEFYKSDGNEPIWSRSTSQDLSNGEEDTVEVILTMQDPKGKEVKFIRNLIFYKNDNGECRKDSEDYEILVDDLPVTFQSTYIRKHLPKNIKEYFLFDGEQLESYFKEDNKNIKKSVYQLSQLDLLEKSISHLKKCETDYSNELSNLNPMLGRLQIKERKLEDNIEKNENLVDEIKDNLIKWKELIDEYSEIIARAGEDPASLISKKEELKTQLGKLEERHDRAEEDRGTFLIDNFSKIFSVSALFEVKDICEYLKEQGFIPARFKKEFLEYLLKEHECICGADLSEGTPAHNKIQELYNKTDVTTNIADNVNLLLGNVDSIINNFPINFKEQLTKKLNNIEELNKDIARVNKEINDINVQLGDIDEEEIKKLQEDIIYYEKLSDQKKIEMGKLLNQIEKDKDELTEVKKNIEEERKKAGKKLEIQSSIDLCKDSINELKRIYSELEEDIHNKLQELTSYEFEHIHWKEFYEGVEMDKNYNVAIRKQGSYIVPNDLSKGGQLVLALSFMTALNSLSGFGLPILIDTPLGRLDEPIKENIGKYLPEFTQNKQVTLLVTGSEYSEPFRKGIRDHVGKEYELVYTQEKEGITSIKCKK